MGFLLVHDNLVSWIYCCSVVLWFEVARLLPVLGFVTVRFSEAVSFKPPSLSGQHPAQILCASLCTQRRIVEYLLTTIVVVGQGHSLSGPAGACAILRDEECLVVPQESFSPWLSNIPVLRVLGEINANSPANIFRLDSYSTAVLERSHSVFPKVCLHYGDNWWSGSRSSFQFDSIQLLIWYLFFKYLLPWSLLEIAVGWEAAGTRSLPATPRNSIHAPLRLSYRLELHPNGDVVHVGNH